jgi:hypothetical protein
MLIRRGFDIDIQLWQPTTLLTAMDVHERQRDAIAWESGLNFRKAHASKHSSTRKATSSGGCRSSKPPERPTLRR